MKSIVLLVFLLVCSLSSQAKVSVGDIPPSYLGKDVDGKKVDLSLMTGKVVIITFWATWCPYCVKELETLERIQRQIGKDKLEVVAINLKESNATYRRIKKKLKGFHITLTRDKRGRIGKEYGVTSLPHMYVVGKSGLVEHIHHGYGESMVEQLVEDLNLLLAKKWVAELNGTNN